MRWLVVPMLVLVAAVGALPATASYCHQPPAECAQVTQEPCPKDQCMTDRVKQLTLRDVTVRMWLEFEGEAPVADNPTQESKSTVGGHLLVKVPSGDVAKGRLHFEVERARSTAFTHVPPPVKVLLVGGVTDPVEYLASDGRLLKEYSQELVLSPGQSGQAVTELRAHGLGIGEVPLGVVLGHGEADEPEGARTSLYFVTMAQEEEAGAWESEQVLILVVAAFVVGVLGATVVYYMVVRWRDPAPGQPPRS